MAVHVPHDHSRAVVARTSQEVVSPIVVGCGTVKKRVPSNRDGEAVCVAVRKGMSVWVILVFILTNPISRVVILMGTTIVAITTPSSARVRILIGSPRARSTRVGSIWPVIILL